MSHKRVFFDFRQRLCFQRSSPFSVSYFLVRLDNPTKGMLQALVKQFDNQLISSITHCYVKILCLKFMLVRSIIKGSPKSELEER